MSSVPQKTNLMQKRTAARLAAVQALYQQEQLGSSCQDVYDEFMTYRLYQSESDEEIILDKKLFREIIFSASEFSAQISQLIEVNLSDDWSYERLDRVLRCILRAGISEFLMDKDLAAAIIINEYLNITRCFYNNKETQFVNGILDKVARGLHVRMKGSARHDKKATNKEQVIQDHDTNRAPKWRDESS